MITLTIRTDKPLAEVGLYIDGKRTAYETWEAHRSLADTLHIKIKDMLVGQKKDWSDISRVVVYEGPGSFTGLRIGIAVADTVAYANNIPIVGTTGDDWIDQGVEQLKPLHKQNGYVVPAYGALPHITQSKK